MRKTALWAAVALIASSGILQAQTRPDFSGRWTSDPEPAARGGGGGGGGGAGGGGGRAAGAGNTGAGRAAGAGAAAGTTAAGAAQQGRGRAGGAGAGRGRAGGGGGGGRGRSGDMGSGWGSTITLAQDATSLTVTWQYFARGDLQPAWRFVYSLNGAETTNSVMMGSGAEEMRSRTSWDGDKLVITTHYAYVDPATNQPMTTEVKQILSLPSAEELLVETTRAGVPGGEPSTVSTVYRKVS